MKWNASEKCKTAQNVQVLGFFETEMGFCNFFSVFEIFVNVAKLPKKAIETVKLSKRSKIPFNKKNRSVL